MDFVRETYCPSDYFSEQLADYFECYFVNITFICELIIDKRAQEGLYKAPIYQLIYKHLQLI